MSADIPAGPLLGIFAVSSSYSTFRRVRYIEVLATELKHFSSSDAISFGSAGSVERRGERDWRNLPRLL
jgi:hypothetical protein